MAERSSSRILADRFEYDTIIMDTPANAVLHPAYAAIVRMGPAVRHLILERMESTRCVYWPAVLREIDGAATEPPEGV